MKKLLLKSMLVGVMTLMASSAWAGDKTVVKYSFDDANSPSLTAGSRVTLDYSHTSVITKTAFLNMTNNNNGAAGSSTISLGNEDLSGETWTLTFEWAANGGCNTKTGHTILKAGDTNLFDIVDVANWNTANQLTYGSSSVDLSVPACNKSNRFSITTADLYNTTAYWYHFVITGSDGGVKLTVTNSNSGAEIVKDAVLSETNVTPTSMVVNPSCGGAVGLDELSLSYYVEGEVIQTPLAAYTKVDGISRTITATCDTEGATLYYSTDGENWTEGAEVTVSESGNVYFKAVKGTSESDVLTFAAVAGEAIVLNAPVIDRTSNTSVTISADQTSLLLSPDATIYYTYGEESGSFTGSMTLTVEADATITAYAEYEGYTTSETSERAVALFPTNVIQIENTATKTSGWSANVFSTETITASERTYAALMLDGEQWGQNVYLQTNGAWGLRASGNWYINSNTEESWLLMQSMKKGDIIVVNVTYPASSMVNATFSKYSFGTQHAYEVTEDGDVELSFKKINASTMDYFYGVYAYREAANKTIGLVPDIWAADGATFAAYAWNDGGNAWFPFAEVDGAYATQIPENYTGIILTRINPDGTDEDPWKNVWNQTDDIDFTAVEDGTVFTITGWGEGENPKSTYTTETVTEDLTALKEQLAKAVELAKLLGIDTTDAEALLANEEATKEQLTDALQGTVTSATPKVQETMALIKKFFNTFDGNAAEALAPYFDAVEAAMADTDFDAIYNAAKAIFAQGLTEGQNVLTKAGEYLAKMEDETVNTDLAALNTAVAANNIQNIMDALRQMKADLPDAAQTYAAQVPDLIQEAKADVTAMQTAYNNALTTYLQYKQGKADLVDMGYALYQLIKAVEAYKEAASAVVIESMAIVGDFLGLEATEEDTNPNWNPANGWAMTQDTDNPTIWTLVKEFTAEAKAYEYKATANGNWDDYVLPPGDNDSYTFETAGNYILTFTANTETHELTLSVEKVEETVTYYLVGTMNSWTPSEEYILTPNDKAAEGVEEYMITLDLEADTELKVLTGEGEATVWYPSAENYKVAETGNYVVYFRPNGDGGSDWFYGVILVTKNITDGINGVFNTDQNAAVIYNLSGQKVMKVQKGLYIVNGKKVLMK